MSKKTELVFRISFVIPLIYISWYIIQRVSNSAWIYVLISIGTLLITSIMAIAIREYVFDVNGKSTIGRGTSRNYYGLVFGLISAGMSIIKILTSYESKKYHSILAALFLYFALVSFFMNRKLITIKRDVLIFHHDDLFGGDSQKIRIEDIEEVKIENHIVAIKTKDDEGYMEVNKILKCDRESVIRRFYQLKGETDAKRILVRVPVS